MGSNGQATLPEVTVLKVPNAVAEEWAAIATLAQQPRGSSTVLGRVRLREGKLELSDAVCEQGKVARTYDVQPPQASVPTVVISKADDSHTVEGMSSIRTVRPSLTATYTKRLADASAEANAEKYHTEVDHAGVQRADALNAPVNITHVAKHKKLAKEEFAGRKQELEGDLFTLFEKKDHWSTKDVQRSLGLAHTHATELLTEVAERVKTGPKRGEWVLKAVYRKTGDGEAAMEAA